MARAAFSRCITYAWDVSRTCHGRVADMPRCVSRCVHVQVRGRLVKHVDVGLLDDRQR